MTNSADKPTVYGSSPPSDFEKVDDDSTAQLVKEHWAQISQQFAEMKEYPGHSHKATTKQTNKLKD